MKGKTSRHVLWTIILWVAALWLGTTGAAADGPRRVGVVVVHGDGSVVTRCVAFSESSLTGFEALERTGLDIVSAFNPGQGMAMCRIDGEGCDAGNCFCDMPNYWTYWHLVDGAWQYSSAGGSTHRIYDGDVDCWLWGSGNPPPAISLDEICVPPTATPTKTALPTATAAPEPVVQFSADQTHLPLGACTTLHWQAQHVTAVTLDGENVPASGAREVCPDTSHTYLLIVAGTTGNRTHQVALQVEQPTATASPTPSATATRTPTVEPIDVDLDLDEERVSPGDCTTLHWDITGAIEVLLDGELVAPADSRAVCPDDDHTYVFVITGLADTETHEIRLDVGEDDDPTWTPLPTHTPTATRTPTLTRTPTPPPAAPDMPPAPQPPAAPTPMAMFLADMTRVERGACTTLRWKTAGASKVTLDGETVPGLGSREVCPQESTEYTLHLVGPGSENRATVRVEVIVPKGADASPSPTTAGAAYPAPGAPPAMPGPAPTLLVVFEPALEAGATATALARTQRSTESPPESGLPPAPIAPGAYPNPGPLPVPADPAPLAPSPVEPIVLPPDNATPTTIPAVAALFASPTPMGWTAQGRANSPTYDGRAAGPTYGGVSAEGLGARTDGSAGAAMPPGLKAFGVMAALLAGALVYVQARR